MERVLIVITRKDQPRADPFFTCYMAKHAIFVISVLYIYEYEYYKYLIILIHTLDFPRGDLQP